MRVRTPAPLEPSRVCGSHQCWTSPSMNWRAAARNRCSRVSAGLDTTSAMASWSCAYGFRDQLQRHGILELVAEAVRAACLIEGRSGPHAADERLIEQPAIE